MLVAAAFVPHTALLIPGAAGAADVLGPVREAALTAVGVLSSAAPDRVVVVVPRSDGPPQHRPGPLRASLAAAGIDDDALGWVPRPSRSGGAVTTGEAEPVETADVATSVALLVLRAGGWAGPVEVVAVPAADPSGLRSLGAGLVAPGRVALLLAATLSARRSSDSPLAYDVRAAAVDDAVLADLSDLGPHAVARLAAVPADLARDLAISAWAPWQVLLGALPDGASSCTVHHGGSLTGVRYAVVSWRWP